MREEWREGGKGRSEGGKGARVRGREGRSEGAREEGKKDEGGGREGEGGRTRMRREEVKHWNTSPLSCVTRALFSVVDTCSSPSCVAVPEYRCQEIAPSTQHAPCSYAPGRIVERPLPRDSS